MLSGPLRWTGNWSLDLVSPRPCPIARPRSPFSHCWFLSVSICYKNHVVAVVAAVQSSPVQLFATPIAHQAPLSMGFSRQEYCRGLPFPSPGDLLDPGVEPTSQADFFFLPLSHLGSPIKTITMTTKALLNSVIPLSKLLKLRVVWRATRTWHPDPKR